MDRTYRRKSVVVSRSGNEYTIMDGKKPFANMTVSNMSPIVTLCQKRKYSIQEYIRKGEMYVEGMEKMSSRKGAE